MTRSITASGLYKLYAPPIGQRQIGRGIPVFRGATMQRGHGLGSLVKGLFRTATPLLKKGAIALGKEALSTGLNIMEDTLSGQTLKNATKKNVSRAGKRLMNKSLNGIRKRKQVGGSRVIVLKRKRQRKKRVIRAKGPPAKRRRRQDIFDSF